MIGVLGPTELAALTAITVGAAAQRVTGLGFALVSAPFLVVALGPVQGVIIANALGALTAALVLARAWRDIDRKRLADLLPGTVVAVPAGAVLVHVLPSPWLLLLVGTLCTLAVATAWRARPWPALASRPGAAASGFLSGLFSVLAGTGGPPLTLYAVATAWRSASFTATVQVVLLVNGLLALAIKGIPKQTDLLGWAVLGVLGGILIGTPLARRVGPATGLKLVLVVALFGSLSALLRGLLLL